MLFDQIYSRHNGVWTLSEPSMFKERKSLADVLHPIAELLIEDQYKVALFYDTQGQVSGAISVGDWTSNSFHGVNSIALTTYIYLMSPPDKVALDGNIVYTNNDPIGIGDYFNIKFNASHIRGVRSGVDISDANLESALLARRLNVFYYLMESLSDVRMVTVPDLLEYRRDEIVKLLSDHYGDSTKQLEFLDDRFIVSDREKSNPHDYVGRFIDLSSAVSKIVRGLWGKDPQGSEKALAALLFDAPDGSLHQPEIDGVSYVRTRKKFDPDKLGYVVISVPRGVDLGDFADQVAFEMDSDQQFQIINLIDYEPTDDFEVIYFDIDGRKRLDDTLLEQQFRTLQQHMEYMWPISFVTNASSEILEYLYPNWKIMIPEQYQAMHVVEGKMQDYN